MRNGASHLFKLKEDGNSQTNFAISAQRYGENTVEIKSRLVMPGRWKQQFSPDESR
jgi:hypothetical protein